MNTWNKFIALVIVAVVVVVTWCFIRMVSLRWAYVNEELYFLNKTHIKSQEIKTSINFNWVLLQSVLDYHNRSECDIYTLIFCVIYPTNNRQMWKWLALFFYLLSIDYISRFKSTFSILTHYEMTYFHLLHFIEQLPKTSTSTYEHVKQVCCCYCCRGGGGGGNSVFC